MPKDMPAAQALECARKARRNAEAARRRAPRPWVRWAWEALKLLAAFAAAYALIALALLQG